MSLDERKICDKCNLPFRCPTAQADRFTCGPCQGRYQLPTAAELVGDSEREVKARKECAQRGIDPDEICADGGVTAWMVVDQELCP